MSEGELPPSGGEDEPKKKPESEGKNKNIQGRRVQEPETGIPPGDDLAQRRRDRQRVHDSLKALREEVNQDMPPIAPETIAVGEQSREEIIEAIAQEEALGVTRISREPELESEDPNAVFDEIKASLRELAKQGIEEERDDEALDEEALRLLDEMYPDTSSMQEYIRERRESKETPEE